MSQIEDTPGQTDGSGGSDQATRSDASRYRHAMDTGPQPEKPRTVWCPPDGRLMESIRAGEAEALQLLMDRHWRGVVGYAARMLGSADPAEDVAQEVFVHVWEHRTRWTSGGSVQAYLYRIARNLVLQRFRHRDVRERTEGEIRRRTRMVTTPFQEAVRGELRAAFEEAVAGLPERRREAFLLVRMQGLSLRRAGEVMEVSRRTVANHVYLATCDLEAALRPFLS